MTDLDFSCPACPGRGRTPTDLFLRLFSHNASEYVFTCPCCEQEVRKPADDVLVSQLISAGVAAHIVDAPPEALKPKPGPALTRNDLLDLMLNLEHTDDLVALAARATAP